MRLHESLTRTWPNYSRGGWRRPIERRYGRRNPGNNWGPGDPGTTGLDRGNLSTQQVWTGEPSYITGLGTGSRGAGRDALAACPLVRLLAEADVLAGGEQVAQQALHALRQREQPAAAVPEQGLGQVCAGLRGEDRGDGQVRVHARRHRASQGGG